MFKNQLFHVSKRQLKTIVKTSLSAPFLENQNNSKRMEKRSEENLEEDHFGFRRNMLIPIQLEKQVSFSYINNRESFYLFFFFFNEIECKKGRTRMMQPLWISKDPCITEEKGKLKVDQVRGWWRRFLWTRVLKVWRL